MEGNGETRSGDFTRDEGNKRILIKKLRGEKRNWKRNGQTTLSRQKKKLTGGFEGENFNIKGYKPIARSTPKKIHLKQAKLLRDVILGFFQYLGRHS